MKNSIVRRCPQLLSREPIHWSTELSSRRSFYPLAGMFPRVRGCRRWFTLNPEKFSGPVGGVVRWGHGRYSRRVSPCIRLVGLPD
jgi:hypothetical protein